jgi:hypothetical protein
MDTPIVDTAAAPAETPAVPAAAGSRRPPRASKTAPPVATAPQEGDADAPVQSVGPSGKSSSDLAEWEVAEPVADAAEAKTEGEAGEWDGMTPEEAEEALAALTEYDGRLPLPVRRRGKEAVTYSVRRPSAEQTRISQTMFVKELHRIRREDGIPSMAEFINDLYESLLPEQKAEVARIQDDVTLGIMEKNAALLSIFVGTAYFSLVQYCADTLAENAVYDYKVAATVETFIEKDGQRLWVPVWKDAVTFRNSEDDDIAATIMGDVLALHRKLTSSRFLASSSDAA